MGAKWNLDPKDVGSHESTGSSSYRGSHGRLQTTRHLFSYTLKHIPTGVLVSAKVPPGNYSRKEMRRLREQLYQQLFVELEAKVAKHLRIPGR